MKKIKFCDHALNKFEILEKHNFYVEKNAVKKVVLFPERVMPGSKGRRIAQRKIDEEHLLKVIYEEIEAGIEIITFYPVRRERYED